MPPDRDQTEALEVAHVLFMDLVGYSRLSLEEQDRRIADLQEIVRSTSTFSRAVDNEEVLGHPAGDGMALAFFRDPSAPVQCALDVARAVSEHGHLPLRMGVHSGPVYRGEDINRTPNVRGPGINLAQRVMDCGEAGHILASYTTGDTLNQLEAWQDRLRDIGEAEVKHGLSLRLYSVVDGDLGNAAEPQKVREAADAAEAARHNLQAELTSFIGRDPALAELKTLIDTTRLLTLTGAGGIGKTRLALELGRQVVDRYPDGVWMVELAGVSEEEFVAQAVASALDVRETSGQPLLDTLAQVIRSREMLLIVDNCEHLIDESARVVDALLRRCANLRIVATSRELLAIAGETAWRVPSLATPRTVDDDTSAEEYDAIRLFMDRARAASPTQEIAAADAPLVGEICRRLDGIPLAIELAAARVRSMSVEQIHAALDDRFRLLTGGSRTAMRRQQTLRALIDWSYRLLTDDERSVFGALSVFEGGFTLEAATAVCADDVVAEWEIPEMVTQFVDKSLVRVDAADGSPRYEMLETLREYGLEQIAGDGTAGQIRERHARHFQAYAEERKSDLHSHGQVQRSDELEAEHGNILVGLAWSLEHDVDACLEQCDCLWWFWFERGYWSVARGSYEALLDPSRRSELANRASPLIRLASLYYSLSVRAELVAEYADDAWSLCKDSPDTRLKARACFAMECACRGAGEVAEGLTWSRRCEAIYRAIGDMNSAGVIIASRGYAAMSAGDTVESDSLFGAALPLVRDAGNAFGEALALDGLATVARWEQDYARAEALYEKSLSIQQASSSIYSQSYTLRGLAAIAAAREDYASVHAYITSAVGVAQRLGTVGVEVVTMVELAVCHWQEGDLVAARNVVDGAMAVAQNPATDYDAYLLRTALLVSGALHSATGAASQAREQFVEARCLAPNWDTRSDWRFVEYLGRALVDRGRAGEGLRLIVSAHRWWETEARGPKRDALSLMEISALCRYEALAKKQLRVGEYEKHRADGRQTGLVDALLLAERALDGA